MSFHPKLSRRGFFIYKIYIIMKKDKEITVTLPAEEMFKILLLVNECNSKQNEPTKYNTYLELLKSFWIEWLDEIEFDEDIKEYTMNELEEKLWQKIKIIK